MKRSTLFLGFTLVVLAAALAGLWQAFGPHTAPRPKPAAPPVAEAPRRPPPPVVQPEPNPPEEGVRSVYPGGRPTAPPAPQPETSPPALIVPPPPPAPTPVPDRSAAPAMPAAPRPDEPTPDAAAAPGETVDLNTASAEALNALGAGKIAKTIIANRPYASPDDLVTKRVLKRKDYDAIKARLVVR